eukprot:158840_1
MTSIFIRHFIKKATTLPKRKIITPFQQIAGRNYDEKVVDHFNNPRNVGTLNTEDEDVGTGLVGAPACGDVMRFQLKIDENGKIIDSCFKTFGCGSANASSSFATEKVVGMNLGEASKLTNKDIAKELNLPPVKLHCSMLAEDGIRAAIKDLENKRAAKKAAASTSTTTETSATQ